MENPLRARQNMNIRFHLILYVLCVLLFSSCATAAPTALVTQQTTVSVTPTFSAPIETSTAIPLNVSADVKAELDKEHAINPDGTLNSTLLHSETAKDVTIVPESIAVTASTDTSVTEIITGKDASGQRYIWNGDAGGWVTDFTVDTDYTKPAEAPFLERSGFTDGSANLIVALYNAEHPEIISPNAIMPYYKLRINGQQPNTWYILSLYQDNQYLYKDEQETVQPFKKSEAPYGFAGLLRSADSQGREIDVICQVKRNPKNGDVNSK